jgi:predicted RNA-binding protein
MEISKTVTYKIVATEDEVKAIKVLVEEKVASGAIDATVASLNETLRTI